MAVAHAARERDGTSRRCRLREVVDVVVLGDDVAVALGVVSRSTAPWSFRITVRSSRARSRYLLGVSIRPARRPARGARNCPVVAASPRTRRGRTARPLVEARSSSVVVVRRDDQLLRRRRCSRSTAGTRARKRWSGSAGSRRRRPRACIGRAGPRRAARRRTGTRGAARTRRGRGTGSVWPGTAQALARSAAIPARSRSRSSRPADRTGSRRRRGTGRPLRPESGRQRGRSADHPRQPSAVSFV